MSATTASVTVTPTVEVASTTVKVNGVDVVSGSPSGAIPLSEGINLISVLVTAEDGSSTSYSISVVRPAEINFHYTSVTDLPANFPAFDATGLTADLALGFSPASGTYLTVIRNTGIGFITGQFRRSLSEATSAGSPTTPACSTRRSPAIPRATAFRTWWNTCFMEIPA